MTTASILQGNRKAGSSLVESRVQNVEKHLGKICETVGSITRKSARLRDKGDLLASRLIKYAESSSFNPSSHKNIVHFAQNYAAVQDYNDAKVKRIEANVLKPLMRYGEVCKYMKKTLQSEVAAASREKKASLKLEKLQQKPHSPQLITQAQLELERLQGERRMCEDTLHVEMERFELDRLMNIKRILSEFVKIEMLYHAKALECLAKCFENADQIRVEADFGEFRAALVHADSRHSVTHGGGNPRAGVHMNVSMPVYATHSRHSSETVMGDRVTSVQSSSTHLGQPFRVRISSAAPQTRRYFRDDDI